MLSRLVPAAVTTTVIAATVIGVAPGAVAATAPTQTFTGVYRRVAVHGPDGHSPARGPHGTDGGVRDVLVAGGRAITLRLPGRSALRPGATVRVRGTLTGSTLSAVDATTTSAPPAEVAPTGSAAARTTVLVILATWTAPDAVTQASAATQLFADGDAWRTEVSNGAHGLTGSVTPWLRIAGPTDGKCYTYADQTMTQARAAAVAAGYDPAAYQRVVLYHPKGDNADCSGYGGWAYQPGSEVWLNGEMTRRTAMHELGHNDGLWHAGTLRCISDGSYVTLAGSGCTVADYGDLTDAMGAAHYAGHFSVVQKSRLGWLAGRHVALSHGSSTVLSPVEQQGTSVIAASVTTATGRRYWFETRGATGADAALPAGVLGGLLIRVEDPSLSPSPLLLDMTPDGMAANAALPPGASWTAPEGFVVRAETAPGGVAVSIGAVAVPGAPQSVTATPGDGSATVAWTAPLSDGGSAVTSYAVSVGAATATVGATARAATVTGLVNGTSYPVTVRALSAAGAGLTAVASVLPADTTAPAAATSVAVSVKSTTAAVSWRNPADLDLAGVVVVMRTGSVPPSSVSDGTTVYSGIGTSATVPGLARGVTYSFAVFARDEVPNWSAGATPAPKVTRR